MIIKMAIKMKDKYISIYNFIDAINTERYNFKPEFKFDVCDKYYEALIEISNISKRSIEYKKIFKEILKDMKLNEEEIPELINECYELVTELLPNNFFVKKRDVKFEKELYNLINILENHIVNEEINEIDTSFDDDIFIYLEKFRNNTTKISIDINFAKNALYNIKQHFSPRMKISTLKCLIDVEYHIKKFHKF